jgi:tetratricopeptide (TPR) repeat protein
LFLLSQGRRLKRLNPLAICMTTYHDDWNALRAKLPASSPVIQRLETFWSTETAPESEYFVALGHAARNGAGAVAAKNAVRVAARRLECGSINNARTAIELAVERCTAAIAALHGQTSEIESASAPTELVAGREQLEGLRSLLRQVQLAASELTSTEAFEELVGLADSGAIEIDSGVARSSLEGLRLERLPGNEYVLIAELHPDDWWNALLVLRNARSELASAYRARDDYKSLATWVPTLRGVNSKSTYRLEQLAKELATKIDASYAPQRTHRRERRILWDASLALRDALATRDTRGELGRWLAVNVTLTLTLYDRLCGLVQPAARVPSDRSRLGWAVHAWYSARLLQYPDGEMVVHAFRRHPAWQSSHALDAEHPEGIAAGCVSAAWYVAQTGYRDEGRQWLERAEALTQKVQTAHRPHRLARLAEAHTALAELYLQEPEQPDVSVELASHAVALAEQCSGNSTQTDRCTRARIKGMSVRAAAFDQKGEFLRAMDERDAALRQLDMASDVLSPYVLMDMKRELFLASGDVDAADRLMLEYMDRASASSAFAVGFMRGTMLLDYGYREAGIDALGQIASRSQTSQWRSRARAVLQSVQSIERPRAWKVEGEAQAAFQEARRLAKTPDAEGQIAIALKANERLLRENPTDLIALTRKAQLLIQRGTLEDLGRAEDALAKAKNDDPYVLFCRGHLAFKRRNFVGAATWLRDAYALAPRAHTAVLLAQALINSKQLTAALDVVDAEDSVEDDAPLLDTKGLVFATMGRHMEAWNCFQQACTALTSGRARLASPTEGPPRRSRMLCRRLACLAPHVAKAQPLAIESFLRRDADAGHTFIMECISQLAFADPLRDLILQAGRIPSLHRCVAQYAMGACVYADTMGQPEGIETILSTVWQVLGLDHNRFLIAELLAGGKSAYRPSIRSALDGDPAHTRNNARRWLAPSVSRWHDITKHVSTTTSSATYYRDTARLVDKHRELWSSLTALIEHVKAQVSSVRMAHLDDWELPSVLGQIDAQLTQNNYFELLAKAARLAGASLAIVNTADLDLHNAPRHLVNVSPATMRLAVNYAGAPSGCELLASEDTAMGLRITFEGDEWPDALRELLKSEHLMPRDDQRSIILDVEATPEKYSFGSN